MTNSRVAPFIALVLLVCVFVLSSGPPESMATVQTVLIDIWDGDGSGDDCIEHVQDLNVGRNTTHNGSSCTLGGYLTEEEWALAEEI